MNNNKKILIVDDEENIRRIFKKALEKKHYTVHTSPNAEDAILKIKNQQYFMVFSDIFMNSMSGIDLLKEIKKDNNELWEIGASIYRINDNSFKEPITIKKYITEENDIKVIIGENIYLKSSDIITENVTAKLISNKIRE